MPGAPRAASVAGMNTALPLSVLAAGILLVACSPAEHEVALPMPENLLPDAIDWRVSTHRDGDDLLSAGLGLDGLRAMAPPPFTDPAAPTADELRRRAIWASWRGIADFSTPDGAGIGPDGLAAVPGREYQLLPVLPGRPQPHRVLVQVPDDFDAQGRCLVVTAASGSRGAWGATALASAWGLPRGCAVAHTDKATGPAWVALPDGRSPGLDGRIGSGDVAEFDTAAFAGDGHRVAVKHAHSGDNPEAVWGLHVRQAAEAGLRALADAHPDLAPFTFDNTRVIAVGVSNGGGAVLRAAELDGGWLDGVVAVSPNIWAGEGGRPLYDYATEAALLMPCALLAPAFDDEPLARPGGLRPAPWAVRCSLLAEAGVLAGADTDARADAAYQRLREGGWSDAALAAGALSVGFDLWRSVAVTYASAYARRGPDDMPCGYGFAVLDGEGRARAPTAAEQAAWWSDASGIPPSAGVQIIDARAVDAPAADPALPGLGCLRGLWADGTVHGLHLREGVSVTRAALPAEGLPVLVIHGLDDGLIPEAMSARPWVDWTQAAGRPVTYWPLAGVQHFDAFLGLPGLGQRYRPLLPPALAGMDAMWRHVVDGEALPGSPPG